jgi:hypothetical protein
MKEREAQAACVLAVRRGNPMDNRNIGRLRYIKRSQMLWWQHLKHMISRQLYAMRSFSGIRKNIGELFQT